MQVSCPTIAELFEENLELAYKNDRLNLLLTHEPKPEWVKTHPFIRDYRYLPIDKVEHLLRHIFKKYRIEITAQGTAFNGVYVCVRVHYLNPTTGEMDFHDGIGAAQLQTTKGTSPADLANINNGAISMAFPIAKTVAIKDACDHFGALFGANLNRKDTIAFAPDASLRNINQVNTDKQRQRVIEHMANITNIKELEQFKETALRNDCESEYIHYYGQLKSSK